MKGRKRRSGLDSIATLAHLMQKKWEEKKWFTTIFMDLIGAFDQVSKDSS